MSNSVNEEGLGRKLQKALIKLDKKFPALNKRKKPIGRTGKQGGNY